MRTHISDRRRWILAPVTAAVAVGIGLLAAPSAGADTNEPSCRTSGPGTLCQKQGHSALHARPVMPTGQSSLLDGAWMPGYGRGPSIPFWAYD